MTAPVSFTRAGVLRGMRSCLPFVIGVIPFGLVCGITAQGVGLSLAEVTLMSAFVYAGASQLVALAIWSHPPGLLTVTLAALVVNLRLALMGPVLSPWLSQIRGWRLWGGLFLMSDQNWGLSVREMNAGGRDAGFLTGSGLVLWITWVVTSALGHELGAEMRPAPGHPLFFAALAVFVSMLAQMWRGRVDLVPWAVAAIVSTGVAQLLPGTFWYIIAGALAGSIVGGLRDHRRHA
jgi:predicted branched-subunit amino acid permease